MRGGKRKGRGWEVRGGEGTEGEGQASKYFGLEPSLSSRPDILRHVVPHKAFFTGHEIKLTELTCTKLTHLHETFIGHVRQRHDMAAVKL